MVSLKNYREGLKAAQVLRALLGGPDWLRDVTVEVEQETGMVRLVAHLLYDCTAINLCVPVAVNNYPVTKRYVNAEPETA